MTPSESPSVSVVRCGQARAGSDPFRTVVRVRGGHDAATSEQLSIKLAQAAALDGADIVVDLSGVTFMDASTIGALVLAGNRLRHLSRSMSFREPSTSALRVLRLCHAQPSADQEAAPSQAPARSTVQHCSASPASVQHGQPFW